MAEFSKLVITSNGQALISKVLAGKQGVEFTKICASSTTYTIAQLEALTALSNVKQTSLVSKITRTNEVAVQVETAFTNTDIKTGYYMRTLGLYAVDPDKGEILYAVTIETSGNCYMPPYNGITVSGAYVKLVTTIGNADNVSLEVDQAAVATIGDIQELEKEISDLRAFVGYTDDDIFGVEVDFKNKTFTRLAGAVNRAAGSGFNDIECFGGRKRCNLTNAGEVVAYHGEAGFSTTGKLTQAVIVGEGEEAKTFPAGTIVQTMVEQPKFYYKVVPLKMEKIQGGKGFHMRKARYYVSPTAKAGFKLHPAFIQNEVVNNVIYLAAFEGSLWDASANAYLLNDEQVADFAADMLCSIGSAKPYSGLTQNATRANTRAISAKRGSGWSQWYAATVAASQMLMMIEYNTFNLQSAIGMGAVSKSDDGATSMTEYTGATIPLGNDSGVVVNANGVQIVSYRGEENFWGNIWAWVDGINVYCYGEHEIYIADHAFVDNTANGYKATGFTAAKTNGYVSAFGFGDDEFDWLFIPSETTGNSSLPVGDHYWQNATYNGWLVAPLGGRWNDGSNAGAFCWSLSTGSGNRYRNVGGRLVYVPSAKAA